MTETLLQKLRRIAEQDNDLFGPSSVPHHCAEAADEIERLRGDLQTVTNCIDDILYDPTFHPRDEYGDEIRGNDMYLVPHPVQEIHMPALRMWFVQRAKEDTAARAAVGGE